MDAIPEAVPSHEVMRRELHERRLISAEEALAQGDHTAADRQLLQRKIYLALFELDHLPRAAQIAQRMCQTSDSSLLDVAYQDAARVHLALGNRAQAISCLRLAGRHTPPERKSFHLWSLALAQHFYGASEDALGTLTRALRHSTRDRPLLLAQRAFIRLELGRPVSRLTQVRDGLIASKSREGYGQFLLGMIAHHVGDDASARVHLRAFLHRNASISRAKAATLVDELTRAKNVLAHTLD